MVLRFNKEVRLNCERVPREHLADPPVGAIGVGEIRGVAGAVAEGVVEPSRERANRDQMGGFTAEVAGATTMASGLKPVFVLTTHVAEVP